MTTLNLKTLCTALGFTAVVMQGSKLSKKDEALRATGVANLIEAFCREAELGTCGFDKHKTFGLLNVGGTQHAPEPLTPRELEILTYIACGKTRREISVDLAISDETVKNYIEKLCRKLNAANKTQAVTIALTLGLIKPY